MDESMSTMITGLVLMAVTGAIMIGLFLVFRAVVLWYWKLDRIVVLLESIDRKLDPKPTR